jgi:hypothetical protein
MNNDLRYINHMNKRAFSIVTGVILLLCFAIPLSAVDINVDYLDGKLEYREGRDTWKQLGIGDTIPDGSTIRLSGRGFAELSAGAKKVTITTDGVYESSDLIGEEPEKANFRQLIGSKFLSLLKRDNSNQNTAAAVRAAEAESDDFISWEDESSDYLMDGMELFDEGDYIGARDLFTEGSLWETGATQRECTFRLGVCEQILGDPRAARNTLSSISPESDDPFLAEYTIVMATLYIESMEYDEADSVLAIFLDTEPEGDAAQAAWLLSAYSLDGQGNMTGSRVSLQKAVDLGPRTEIGVAAAEMLDG